jgi:hypothetical protein
MTWIVHNTGLPSEKVFMPPEKTKIKATNKMQLKHNLRPKASEINIVPNLHSMLISVQKMADTDYIVVFDKNEARISNATTTIVLAPKDPLLVTPRCQDTGLWEINLDCRVLDQEYPSSSLWALMKQMPSLTSPTTNKPYYTTAHWRDSPRSNAFGRSPDGKLCNVARPDNNPHIQAFP